MSDQITDEMVEAVAKLLDPEAWEMSAGVYQDSHGRSYGNAESFIRSARATARNAARRILRVTTPIIAAQALREAAVDWEALVQCEIPPGPASVWLNRRADRVEGKS